MWGIILGSAALLTLLGAVYLMFCVSNFSVIKSISRGKKGTGRLISLLIIFAAFTALCFIFSVVNAVVIFLLVLMFFAVYGLLMRVIKHFSKKEPKIYWQGWLALLSSAVYLVIGWYLCHNVWRTDYTLHTDKEIGTLKIAMFSDSHIGTTFGGEGFAEHMETIDSQNPDIVIIAGDYVDDWSNKADMVRACEALGKMNAKYGVWYAYGNHDAGFFSDRDFSADELEQTLIANGVHVLSDEYELVDDRFYVVGRKDKTDRDRKDINELLQGLDTSKYIIVIDHQPNDYDNEADSPADLVLSGHTHGGQLFPITHSGEWFGVNDRTYGFERRGSTDFIVSSGIADWAIYFKTGTKSEYVMVEATENSR